MWEKRLMWVVWPAFLAAGAMDALVFSAFDPYDMLWLGQGFEMSRTSIYSVTFFIFWAVFSLAGSVMVLLSTPTSQVKAISG